MNLLRARLLAFTLVVFAASGCGHSTSIRSDSTGNRVQVLNQLRDDIDSHYGFWGETPRVNRGPCGRFADAFREQWNARFRDKVDIAFLIVTNTSLCAHIVIKFSDGSYFDGGNGVMSERALLRMCPDCKVEVMTKYDRRCLNKRCDNLLDRRCDGIDYVYPICPKYRDELTAQIIQSHLAMLRGDGDER
jgi:hypothetical protein